LSGLIAACFAIIHRIAADILCCFQYVRRYAVDAYFSPQKQRNAFVHSTPTNLTTKFALALQGLLWGAVTTRALPLRPTMLCDPPTSRSAWQAMLVDDWDHAINRPPASSPLS